MDLICPAGNLPSLKAAIDNGADAVYMGFKDDTNARHFAGLNFNDQTFAEGIDYVHRHGRKIFVAINTFPQPSGWKRWTRAVDIAAQSGVDALIVADPGVLRYASDSWPELRLHLSVQGSATNPEAIAFYHRHFGVQRAVLPRVLSVKQVAHIVEQAPVEIEVFGFGSLCVMVEGRCLLSSYATGQSPNTYGACSPASHVRWEETDRGREVRLNNILIDRYAASEPAGYPTLCKGRFQVGDHTFYALEEPTSLNTLDLLPDLARIGVSAIKVEGRQRTRAYVAEVTRVLRAALDRVAEDPEGFKVEGDWMSDLDALSEGTQTTLGAYHRPWM